MNGAPSLLHAGAAASGPSETPGQAWAKLDMKPQHHKAPDVPQQLFAAGMRMLQPAVHMQLGAPQSLSVLCRSAHAAGRGSKWLATRCHLKLLPCHCQSRSNSRALCSFSLYVRFLPGHEGSCPAPSPLQGAQWFQYGTTVPPEAGLSHALP